MFRGSISAWAIYILLTFSSSVAYSQEDQRSLIQICEDDPLSGAGLAVCDEYIAEHYQEHADILIGISQAIDDQKDRIKPLIEDANFWNHTMQGSLIILAFLTTIATAIARIYRDRPLGKKYEVGVWPILLAACVSALTSFNAYYKFDEIRDRHKVATNKLVRLQSDFNFKLVTAARLKGDEALSLDEAMVWKEKLDGILAIYVEEEKPSGKEK